MTSIPLYTLPIELLEAILAELSYPDLANVRNVSRAWRTLCNSTAIPVERRRLLELRSSSRNNLAVSTVRQRTKTFIQPSFDRAAYLKGISQDDQRLNGASGIPAEFETWLLETPAEDIVGWHWPGLRGEHEREAHVARGIDFVNAMMFSRHIKPGYTLLPSACVMAVEDPDLAELQGTDNGPLPGSSWQSSRTRRDTKVRALQIWADLSGFTPKITLLLLSGSERWNGTVWLVEPRNPFGHTIENMREGAQLIWKEPLGSWINYLKNECKEYRERHSTWERTRTYRAGLNGRVYNYTVPVAGL